MDPEIVRLGSQGNHYFSDNESDICSDNGSEFNSEQLGWNCFDLAVGGIDRTKLVKYALAQSDDVSVRKLLAPEIKHAAALTVAYQNALRFKPTLPRGTNLLPTVMFTEEMRQLYNQYDGIENTPEVRNAWSECNNIIGNLDGNRLNWQQLELFFNEAGNRNSYPNGYQLFSSTYTQVTKAVNEFNEYCCRPDVYQLYVKEYYGKNEWVAFNAEVTNDRSTGMIDIIAKMLQGMIATTLPDGRVYATDAYGPQVINIDYNGNNHFAASIPVASSHVNADKKAGDSSIINSASNANKLTIEDGDNLPFLKEILKIFLADEIDENICYNGPLLKLPQRKPADFYTNFQKNLYMEFFENREYGERIVNWYLTRLIINASWWFLPKEKTLPYLNFYTRFKLAISTLFIENRDELTSEQLESTPKPSKNERALIDLVFYLGFLDEFNKHQYYKHAITPINISDVTVKRTETALVFMFNDFQLNLKIDKYSECFARLIRGDAAKIEKLKFEVAQKDVVIAQKDVVIAGLETELLATKTEADNARTKLKDQELVIGKLNSFIINMKAIDQKRTKNKATSGGENSTMFPNNESASFKNEAEDEHKSCAGSNR